MVDSLFPQQHNHPKTYNSTVYSLHTHKIWKRSVEKYKSYRTLNETIHFLSVSCEAGFVQQCKLGKLGPIWVKQFWRGIADYILYNSKTDT